MLGFWLPCWFNRQRCIKLLYSLALGCPTLTGFAKEGLRILASLPTCAHAPISHHPHLTSFCVLFGPGVCWVVSVSHHLFIWGPHHSGTHTKSLMCINARNGVKAKDQTNSVLSTNNLVQKFWHFDAHLLFRSSIFKLLRPFDLYSVEVLDLRPLTEVRYSRRSAALQAAASGMEDLVACWAAQR